MATGRKAQTVQNGGFWNSQQASYSPATQNLLRGKTYRI